MKTGLRALPADPINWKDEGEIPALSAGPERWDGFWRHYSIERIPVYLAGGKPRGADWRKTLEFTLPITGFDPFRDAKQEALYQFVHGDLAAIDAAKLVIAYYPGGYSSHGMAAEIGYAVGKSIPVFYIDESEAPDLFLTGCSKRFFSSVESCITWWARRVMHGVPVP